jgi:hypothetical protein
MWKAAVKGKEKEEKKAAVKRSFCRTCSGAAVGAAAHARYWLAAVGLFLYLHEHLDNNCKRINTYMKLEYYDHKNMKNTITSRCFER